MTTAEPDIRLESLVLAYREKWRRRNLILFASALEQERLAVMAIGPEGIDEAPWLLALRESWQGATLDAATYTQEHLAAAKGILNDLDSQDLNSITRRKAQRLAEISRDTVLELAAIGDAGFIDDVYSDWLGTRVATLADAEAVAATAWGQASAAAAAGGLFKKWNTQRDNKVRPTHQEAGRAPRIPIDQPYIVGGELLRFPADPGGHPSQTANCRCWESYVKPRRR